MTLYVQVPSLYLLTGQDCRGRTWKTPYQPINRAHHLFPFPTQTHTHTQRSLWYRGWIAAAADARLDVIVIASGCLLCRAFGQACIPNSDSAKGVCLGPRSDDAWKPWFAVSEPFHTHPANHLAQAGPPTATWWLGLSQVILCLFGRSSNEPCIILW